MAEKLWNTLVPFLSGNLRLADTLFMILVLKYVLLEF